MLRERSFAADSRITSRRVRHPAGVKQLGEDHASGRMDRIGDLPPASFLSSGVKAGPVVVPGPLPGHRRRLGDDQARPGPLRVVLGREFGLDSVLVGPGPGERGHHRINDRLCAQDESARNAGGTPGCGTVDGAARRTRGTQTGSPPVPAGRGCRRPACGVPAEREASAAFALPVRTRNDGARVRTLRTGSLAPRPALCRAAAARAAGCPMRSYVHGRTAVSPVGTAR